MVVPIRKPYIYKLFCPSKTQLKDAIQTALERGIKIEECELDPCLITSSIDQYTSKAAIKILHLFPETHLISKDRESINEFLQGPILECVFAEKSNNFSNAVGTSLIKSKRTLAVAESCTGGLIGHLLTNTGGSSGYYLGGVIAYTNELKEKILNVSFTAINKFGAVSEDVVRGMSEGIKNITDANLGLAVSGIAGPSGGSLDKPVGTVFICLTSDEKNFIKEYHFNGSRENIKLLSAYSALDMVRRFCYEIL